MCGICGIVDFSGAPIAPAAVDRMRDSMAVRGPDDADSKVLAHVGLGHRRLSIIDLSPRGRQPMTNEDESIWLVFNGEIYDFEPLRAELVGAGHGFRSDSDSEVLVHGYEEWGIEGLAQRINGMFAFALWDARSQQLHLVRDRLGKKPLFYGTHRGRFLFGSDVKAIWTEADGALRVDGDSLGRFLYWGYLPGRETIYRDVYQVLPARIVTLSRDGLQERRYWRLSFASKVQSSFSDVVERTDALLTAAVRRRLRSDVPLGAFLSGGVDSSYIVSRMAGGLGGVRTFSMGTSDAGHDERAHARRVADHLGTTHTEFEVTTDVWPLLPRLVWEFGQPFADPACVPTFLVAEQARRHVTVTLTGDGGDEMFAGYSQHQGRYLAGLLRRVIPGAAIPPLLARSRSLMDDGGPALQASAIRFARYMHPDPLVHWSSADMWALHHMPQVFSRSHRQSHSPESLVRYALEADAEFDGSSPLDRALNHDLNVLLPFCYNPKVDVMTMANSIEARCPFQDREIAEWTASLPAAMKMKPWEKKSLLKQVAVRWVPRDVIYRPKHGFSMPLDTWFRGEWGPRARAIVFSDQARDRGYFDYDYLETLWQAHASGRSNHGARFWSLLWLEMWLRFFVDRTWAPPSVGQSPDTNMVFA